MPDSEELLERRDKHVKRATWGVMDEEVYEDANFYQKLSDDALRELRTVERELAQLQTRCEKEDRVLLASLRSIEWCDNGLCPACKGPIDLFEPVHDENCFIARWIIGLSHRLGEELL